ncbi:putative transposase, Tnp1/En/Spm [Helianthus debilis subsp. tardiflorus]
MNLITLKVGDEVFLKNILNSTETVARGRVQNLDPNDLVGGTEIGPEWYEVNVKVPIKKDENLVRSYGLFSTIQDCIGVSIAWSYPFISVCICYTCDTNNFNIMELNAYTWMIYL